MEDKSLKTIQKLAKAGNILSKIAFIFGIIGAASCAIGMIALALGMTQVMTFGEISIHGMIKESTGISIGSMYASMAVGMVYCAGEIFVAKMAERYFKHELADGTPFTYQGADELKRLGIVAICTPIVTSVAAAFIYMMLNLYFQDLEEMTNEGYGTIGFGIAFLVISVLCRYGAQMRENERNY